jgi:hypothetical protein
MVSFKEKGVSWNWRETHLGQIQSPCRNSCVIGFATSHFRHTLFLEKLTKLHLEQAPREHYSSYAVKVFKVQMESMSKKNFIPKVIIWVNDLLTTLPVPWP